MRYAPKLETLFTGGFVTMTSAATYTQADVGKAIEIDANGEAVLATDGGAIFGRLHSIDPKADDTVVVQVTGYVPLPVVAGSQASIAVSNDVVGYVIGGGSGTVKVLATATVATTASVLELLAGPKKVVEVQSSGAVAVVDLGAKIA